jgi:hypothetical protein
MALIQCPDCKTEISDKAVSCPKCGHPIKVPQSSVDTTGSKSPTREPSKEPRTDMETASKCAFVGFLLGFGLFWGGCFHGGGNLELPDLNEIGVFLLFGSISGAIVSIPGFFFGLFISKKNKE